MSNYISDYEEDSDDDWFYESFKRYDDLLMYDVQGSISCATFLSSSRLLLAASGGTRHEVWELSVPKKLIAGKDAGLTRDRDFSVITAGYTTDSVKRMLSVDSGIVTSGSSGVNYYSIPKASDQTDIITHRMTLRSDTRDAALEVRDTVVFSGTTLSNITKFDLSTSTPCCLPVDASSATSVDKRDHASAISNLFFKNDKLYIGLMNGGNVLVFDTRQNLISNNIRSSDCPGGKWTMDISDDDSFIATASSEGVLRVYDNRNLNEPFFTYSMEIWEISEKKPQDQLIVHISPNDSFVSLSGFGKEIGIFDFKNSDSKASKVFTHDGHREGNVQSIALHNWHPMQEKLVFSADNTGHLQAWRFKVT